MRVRRHFILLALLVLLAGIGHSVQHSLAFHHDPHNNHAAPHHGDAHHAAAHSASAAAPAHNTPDTAPAPAEEHCVLTTQAGQLAYDFTPQFITLKNPHPAPQRVAATPSIARTVLFFSRAPPSLV